MTEEKHRNNTPCKVFISYSWDCKDFAFNLANALRKTGIDVVIDQAYLIPGHNLYAFMEKSVLDPTINKVLILSDSTYVEKANKKQGGVGVETQIISPYLYGQCEQTKFIPVILEWEEINGIKKPCLPAFLASTYGIDLSSQDLEGQEFQDLVRTILSRPLRQLAPLGSPPAWLYSDTPVVSGNSLTPQVNPGLAASSPVSPFYGFLGDLSSVSKQAFAYFAASSERRIRFIPNKDWFYYTIENRVGAQTQYALNLLSNEEYRELLEDLQEATKLDFVEKEEKEAFIIKSKYARLACKALVGDVLKTEFAQAPRYALDILEVACSVRNGVIAVYNDKIRCYDGYGFTREIPAPALSEASIEDLHQAIAFLDKEKYIGYIIKNIPGMRSFLDYESCAPTGKGEFINFLRKTHLN